MDISYLYPIVSTIGILFFLGVIFTSREHSAGGRLRLMSVLYVGFMFLFIMPLAHSGPTVHGAAQDSGFTRDELLSYMAKSFTMWLGWFVCAFVIRHYRLRRYARVH